MILLDAHAHFHPVYAVEDYFNAALANFDKEAGRHAATSCYLLCLVDPAGADTPNLLIGEIRARGSWSFSHTPDQAAILAQRSDGRRLFLIPGRQIVTLENLEVLALNCRLNMVDRTLPIDGVIAAVQAAGGVPVLPWGIGKWTGRRGNVIRQLIHSRRDVLVADNGNRLRGSRLPALLAESRALGIPVLNGSDPLPFARQVDRIAAHGNVLDVDAPPNDPVGALRLLLSRPESWRPYGAGASWTDFAINQVRMQIRKRMG
jgi:hypothetical protein